MKSSKSAIVFASINPEFNLQNSECVYWHIWLYSTLHVCVRKAGLKQCLCIVLNLCAHRQNVLKMLQAG